MIRLVFSIQREAFRIEINGREVWYKDRIWKNAIRIIPKDKEFIQKIMLSRNKIPMKVKELFNLTKKELEEYNSANSEEELSDICIKDCRLKGARLLKKDYGNA